MFFFGLVFMFVEIAKYLLSFSYVMWLKLVGKGILLKEASIK